ncbi:SDR family oxidoreductase [Williamsia sp. 1135]|uniref:SDR family NAD(P)-dependent oxidoreductase n=1 Tax=Williamsia sp. 1135 TaxID=1889262 RepID=UPI001F0AC188|nr:SDR family oxidoreductase [Williamsia sp. 1135]
MSSSPVSIIIGGASGIGLATAQELSGTGDLVVIADVNAAAAAERAGEIGGQSVSAAVDVTSEESVSALFDHVSEKYGKPQSVVNCAGLTIPGAIADLSLADWNTTIAVCQTGTFLTLKYASRHILDGGSIVTIASLNGRQPAKGMAAYCAAKAAVLMLTEVAALELGDRGVRVNAISPGLVDTPLVAGLSLVPGMLEDYHENTPLGRSGKPEEIAAMVAFLLSDKAAWITGAAFDVNGDAHTRRYPDLLKHLAAMS